MRKILIILFLLLTSLSIAQTRVDDPIGHTYNYGLRLWGRAARPSADSMNQNWRDIDNAIHAIDTNVAKLITNTVNGISILSNPVLTSDDIINFDAALVDPHDFDMGDVLTVDTLNGDTVFVGKSPGTSNGSAGLNEIVMIINFDLLYVNILSNTTEYDISSAIITMLEGEGIYELSFLPTGLNPLFRYTISPTGFTDGSRFYNIVGSDELFDERVSRLVVFNTGNLSAATGSRIVSLQLYPIYVPLLTTPYWNETFPINSEVNFEWTESVDAISYDMQIGYTSDFNQPLFVENNNVLGTSVTAEMESYGTFYWRVRAKTGVATYTEWSTPRTIIISF